MKEWNYENDQWTKLPSYLKHLPLFTRNYDWFSMFFRFLWANILKFIFHSYIQLKVKGRSFSEIHKEYPRLILISNHSSHLDAVSIAAAVPQLYWHHLFIAAAKDYFFTNALFTFFSKHCLGAIPVDRKDKKGQAVQLILTLLKNLPRMWLIIFPEGTRSKDGKIQNFKRGISLFSIETNTPILFLYIDGNAKLWPKGAVFTKPGVLTIHIGPVHPPGPIEDVYQAYMEWAKTLDPQIEFHDWKEQQPQKNNHLKPEDRPADINLSVEKP